jgi:flagellar basal body rod protein FlgG
MILLPSLYSNIHDDISVLLKDLLNLNTIGYKPISTIENQYSYLQGRLIKMDGTLVFAIAGDGFFRVYNHEGDMFFSRCGWFVINKNYQLVTNDGLIFYSTAKKIEIASVFINVNGIIKIIYSDSTSEELKLDLFVPEFDSQNKSYGNYYQFSEVRKIENSKIVQNFLELSSVDGIKTALQLQEKNFQLFEQNSLDKEKYNYNQSIINQIIFALFYFQKMKTEDMAFDFSQQKIYYYDYNFIDIIIPYLDFSIR